MIQARYYTKGPRKSPITQIIIHSMESQGKSDTAETVARWFASPGSPKTSIHYCADNTSVVQCVKDKDIAWHSGNWDVNDRSLGIELAGRASQDNKDWRDPYSLSMLNKAAAVVAHWCKAYKIPVKHLTPAEVHTNKKGICGHVDVTKAYGVVGGHTDPGVDFPWPLFLKLVMKHMV